MTSMAVDFAVHDEPVWRDKANFLILADLAEHGMPGRWEQLWTRQIANNKFELCCLPYFTYGLALGDVVNTKPRRGMNDVLARVLKRSGRHLLRLWLKNGNALGKEYIYAYIAENRPLHEWSSEHLVAIDVVPSAGVIMPPLITLLEDLKETGVEVEWGHM
jgi:Domain of unknown function (DUF4265)